jgi:hypothetical protein
MHLKYLYNHRFRIFLNPKTAIYVKNCEKLIKNVFESISVVQCKIDTIDYQKETGLWQIVYNKPNSTIKTAIKAT